MWEFKPFAFAFFPKKCVICGRRVWLEYWDGDIITIRCRECMKKWEYQSKIEDNYKKIRKLWVGWETERKIKQLKDDYKKIYGGVCG
jgi:hypothetical protein